MTIHRLGSGQMTLRPEIALHAENVTDRSGKHERLVELLRGLNPETSRAVVFVTSRRIAEELARHVRMETELAAAPFHAGLPAEVRMETYARFRDDGFPVLCATKAFGMGMDIDNIHLVVHFGPPSSLEDYIQEIGRAARNPKTLAAAKLEQAQAYLLYEPGDFGRMRDRLKGDFLSSMDLRELHTLLTDEWTHAGSNPDHVLSVRPGRLASRLRGGGGTANQVRLGLYWLGELGRTRVGFYTPAHVEVEVYPAQAHTIRRTLDPDVKRLLDHLLSLARKAGQDIIAFQARDVRVLLGFSTQNELFAHVAELARRKAIHYRRKLVLPLAERRAQEGRAGVESQTWPLLDAVLTAILRLGEDLDLDAERAYTHDELKAQFAEVAADCFRPEDFAWLEAAEREDQTQRERQSFPRLVPAVLRLLRGLHVVRVTEDIDADGLKLHLSLYRQDWDLWLLDALPALVKTSLENIVTQEQSREPAANEDVGEVDAQELFLAVQASAQPHDISFSISHLQVILRFLRDLGYLRRSDVFVPIALEVQVLDTTPISLEGDGRDAETLRRFEEQKQLRVLRLAALQAIPYLAKDRARLDEFVDGRYFRSASPEDLFALLEEILPAENEILRQLREDALTEMLEELSDEQRSVYDAPLDRHVMVVAGPGAGKTHTLLARLVRLVHKEDVRSSEILVLAFTRAVVSELRYRLQHLLGQLGYGVLARSIQVTTFHSFILRTLREHDLVPDDFGLEKDWFAEFEKLLQKNPVLSHSVATRYRYVFVDEFQDVHGARYRLLDYLAQGRQTYLLVVGDDDQSIYDYERDTGEGNAVQYFDGFASQYGPLRFDLTRNYRSARAIVELTQRAISALPDRLKAKQVLVPDRSAQGLATWQRAGADLVALIRKVEQVLRDIPNRRANHMTIAVLVRTNADVYRVRETLTQEWHERFTLLIQGQESRFVDRRDVAGILSVLSDQNDVQQANEGLEGMLQKLLSGMRVQHWSREQPVEQHELWYLAQEFLEGAGPDDTISGFVEYVRELSKNGNYLRVVARRQSLANERILLSTIHKVKGLEFPAVVLLDADLRVDDPAQELRVMYVGMTRAEDVLVAVQGEREGLVLQQQPFLPDSRRLTELAVAPSLSDVYISHFGRDWNTQRIVFDHVRSGDSITIERAPSSRFRIVHDETGRELGRLASPSGEKHNLAWRLQQHFGGGSAFVGLEVAGVYRRSTELDRQYDDRRDSQFYDLLCDEVKRTGHYYVVEIGGLVRPV